MAARRADSTPIEALDTLTEEKVASSLDGSRQLTGNASVAADGLWRGRISAYVPFQNAK